MNYARHIRFWVHFSKRRQPCVHDLFSVEVLLRIRGPCVSNISWLPTYFLNERALQMAVGWDFHVKFLWKVKMRQSEPSLKGRLLSPVSGDQGSSYFRRLNYSAGVDSYYAAPWGKCRPTVRFGALKLSVWTRGFPRGPSGSASCRQLLRGPVRSIVRVLSHVGLLQNL